MEEIREVTERSLGMVAQSAEDEWL